MQCIFASVLSLNVLCVEAELYIYISCIFFAIPPPHPEASLSVSFYIWIIFSLSGQPVYTRGINPQPYIVLGWAKVEQKLRNRWRDFFIKDKIFLEIILNVWCKRKIKKTLWNIKIICYMLNENSCTLIYYRLFNLTWLVWLTWCEFLRFLTRWINKEHRVEYCLFFSTRRKFLLYSDAEALSEQLGTRDNCKDNLTQSWAHATTVRPIWHQSWPHATTVRTI